jgi:hypothetical protein
LVSSAALCRIGEQTFAEGDAVVAERPERELAIIAGRRQAAA